MFDEIITSRDRLREVRKEPSRLVSAKVIDRIDDMCRRFIAASPFVVVASTGAGGAVDLSPKGDPAGFVRVLSPRLLAIPDRPGNHGADTMENLLEDDRIGLIFLIPGRRETLRVSGRGRIVRDAALNARMEHKGREPHLALVVEVERAFFHCAKCMIRSGMWEPEQWPSGEGLPSLAETMKHHGRLEDAVGDVAEIVRKDAAERLY